MVFEAIERSVDQVQLIHDQTLRLIAQRHGSAGGGRGPLYAAPLREGREAYGQVESHVRQVYNGTVGWFDGEVYDINPLSLHEEANRTVEMMGGRDIRPQWPRSSRRNGGLANWRWSLKLTSMLLRLDPADAEARQDAAPIQHARSDSARPPPMREASTSPRRCSSRAS